MIPYLHNAIFKVNSFQDSLSSFWSMRSHRSRRRDKGKQYKKQLPAQETLIGNTICTTDTVRQCNKHSVDRPLASQAVEENNHLKKSFASQALSDKCGGKTIDLSYFILSCMTFSPSITCFINSIIPVVNM